MHLSDIFYFSTQFSGKGEVKANDKVEVINLEERTSEMLPRPSMPIQSSTYTKPQEDNLSDIDMMYASLLFEESGDLEYLAEEEQFF